MNANLPRGEADAKANDDYWGDLPPFRTLVDYIEWHTEKDLLKEMMVAADHAPKHMGDLKKMIVGAAEYYEELGEQSGAFKDKSAEFMAMVLGQMDIYREEGQ